MEVLCGAPGPGRALRQGGEVECVRSCLRAMQIHSGFAMWEYLPSKAPVPQPLLPSLGTIQLTATQEDVGDYLMKAQPQLMQFLGNLRNLGDAAAPGKLQGL